MATSPALLSHLRVVFKEDKSKISLLVLSIPAMEDWKMNRLAVEIAYLYMMRLGTSANLPFRTLRYFFICRQQRLFLKKDIKMASIHFVL